MMSVKVLTLSLFALVSLTFFFQPETSAREGEAQEATSAKAPQITVKGKVFCLDEKGHRLETLQDCNKATQLYEIITSDKKTYKFSPDDVLTSMFKEARVRKLDLQISGLVHDKNTLEIASLHAIQDGQLFDIFYYCDICSITAYGPGDCACCYNPLEFRMKPALDN